MRKFTLITVFVLLSALPVLAWEDSTTHPTLSEYAAKGYATNSASELFSTVFLDTNVEQSGSTLKAIKWINLGAQLEDAGTNWQFLNGMARSLNHFHDPTKANLDDAGLNDLPFFIPNGISALRWAQKGPYQISKGWEDWSWQAVRKHYYNYLITSDKTAKDAFLADLLKGLGYQMHTIQDMSQPNHVRNDTHMLDGGGWRNGLETWAAEHDTDIIRNILDTTPIPSVTVDLTATFSADTSLSPVANLFDTRKYVVTQAPSASSGQGLAEYTNANFFSEDTSFAAEGYSPGNKHYFPHPSKDETWICPGFVDS